MHTEITYALRQKLRPTFSDTKINMMPSSNLHNFLRFMKCMLVVLSYENILTLALNRYVPKSKGDERIYEKINLNIIVNIMEWNLTDSDEMFETSILTHSRDLVQIS